MEYQKLIPEYSKEHLALLKVENDSQPSLWVQRKRLSRKDRMSLFQKSVDKINTLKADYDNVIEERMKTKREQVEVITKKRVGTMYVYHFTLDNWECQLEVKKFENKDDEANYYIFNDFDNIVFVRSLKDL